MTNKQIDLFVILFYTIPYCCPSLAPFAPLSIRPWNVKQFLQRHVCSYTVSTSVCKIPLEVQEKITFSIIWLNWPFKPSNWNHLTVFFLQPALTQTRTVWSQATTLKGFCCARVLCRVSSLQMASLHVVGTQLGWCHHPPPEKQSSDSIGSCWNESDGADGRAKERERETHAVDMYVYKRAHRNVQGLPQFP